MCRGAAFQHTGENFVDGYALSIDQGNSNGASPAFIPMA
jgi:hypothetical protein